MAAPKQDDFRMSSSGTSLTVIFAPTGEEFAYDMRGGTVVLVARKPGRCNAEPPDFGTLEQKANALARAASKKATG